MSQEATQEQPETSVAGTAAAHPQPAAGMFCIADTCTTHTVQTSVYIVSAHSTMKAVLTICILVSVGSPVQ